MNTISKFNLKNNGAFVAELYVEIFHQDGKKETYKNTDDILAKQSNSVDLTTVSKVREGDTVRLNAFVRAGKDKTSEKYIYSANSPYEAYYTVSGTTLFPKLKLNSIQEYFNVSDYNPAVALCEVDAFKLTNKGGYVARMEIYGIHSNGRSYKCKIGGDICIHGDRSVDLSNRADFVEGDIVYLKAVVVGGDDREAAERFIYRKGCDKRAEYTVGGTILSLSFGLKNLESLYTAPTVYCKQTYSKVGTSPKSEKTDFSNDIQGICHDASHWYVSHGAGSADYDRNHGTLHRVYMGRLGSDTKAKEKQVSDCYVLSHGVKTARRFYKYYDGNVAVGAKIGEIHFGDIDYYNGYIFVPAYQHGYDGYADTQILVFDAKTFDLKCAEVLYKNKAEKIPFADLAWCAVNPNDGCLYTSDSHLSNSFEGKSSPLMAYKINFENLQNESGEVFSLVTPKGIPLKTEDGSDFGMGANMQGGCFDQFDTLYLNSGFMDKHQFNEGINAFKLKRDNTIKIAEYISKRAYFIWMQKGGSIQSTEERFKDWINAEWQIRSALNSGYLKCNETPYKAQVYLQNSDNGKLVSPIDFSFNIKSETLIAATQPQEPEGLTFWDTRKYYKDGDSLYIKSMLHALKLTNNGSRLAIDKFSLENYNMTNLETEEETIDYIPTSLSVEQNPISDRWVVLSEKHVPLKEFLTEEEARKGMSVLSQFSRIDNIGNTACDDDEYDCRVSLLRNPVPNFKSPSVDSQTVQFSEYHVTGWNQGSTSKQVSNSLTVENTTKLHNWETVIQTGAAEIRQGIKYDNVVFRSHNEMDAWKIANSAVGYSKIRCLKSQSGRQRDNLYWFEK